MWFCLMVDNGNIVISCRNTFRIFVSSKLLFCQMYIEIGDECNPIAIFCCLLWVWIVPAPKFLKGYALIYQMRIGCSFLLLHFERICIDFSVVTFWKDKHCFCLAHLLFSTSLSHVPCKHTKEGRRWGSGRVERGVGGIGGEGDADFFRTDGRRTTLR